MQRLAILFLLCASTSGCTPRPLFLQPRPTREWPATLQVAKEAARSGQYAQADSALARFEARHADTYEGREAAYWRALLLVDPAYAAASSSEAIRALNAYFTGRPTVDSYDEATILRRVMQRIDSLTRSLAQADRLIAEAQEAATAPSPSAQQPATPAPAAPSAATARANRNLVEEVRRLRDELAKSNQELERVRKRLSEQRP